MRPAATLIAVASFIAMLCATAIAADKKATSVSVVQKDGKKIELKSLEIGFDERSLFGTSFTKLDKLPIKTGGLHLDVPLKNLAKIEIVSADKEGKKVKVKLTAVNGDKMEGVVDHEKKLIWQGIHPFADSEAKLDPAAIKEIVLRPEKK